MRKILTSILSIVTFLCAFWAQIGFAVDFIQLRKGPFLLPLKAKETRTLDFYKTFFVKTTPVYVAPGTRMEVPTGILEVLVEPSGSGLKATSTRSHLKFITDSKVAGTFTASVMYKARPKILQQFDRRRGTLRWVISGPPQDRTLEIHVGIPLPELDRVVVEEGKEVRITLPKPATGPERVSRHSGSVDVNVQGEEILILGKKSGSDSWDISYEVGRFKFKNPLKIEVVHHRESHEVDLKVNEDKVVLPGSQHPGYKLIRLIKMENFKVCKADKEAKGLRLTGLQVGRTTVTAVAKDSGGRRIGVDISVTVRKGTAPGREPDPAPAPAEIRPAP